MGKFVVKTKLSNIKKEDGQFTYNEEIVSMKWDAKAQRDAVQSGKGPGEFGPDYSDRKRFHLDYHADWEHPTITPLGKPLYNAGENKMSEIRDMGHHHDKDFQNKYVGYMVLALVLGVVGIGVIGLIYFTTTGGY